MVLLFRSTHRPPLPALKHRVMMHWKELVKYSVSCRWVMNSSDICEGGVLLLVLMHNFLGKYEPASWQQVSRIKWLKRHNNKIMTWHCKIVFMCWNSHYFIKRTTWSLEIFIRDKLGFKYFTATPPIINKTCCVDGAWNNWEVPTHSQVFETHLLFATWRCMMTIVGSRCIQSHKAFS